MGRRSRGPTPPPPARGVTIGGVNARGLRELERLLKRTFGTQGPRDFRREMESINSSLRDNEREQMRVARALTKVERGSDAYKKMARNLREAQREAAALNKVLREVPSHQDGQGRWRNAFGQYVRGGSAGGGGGGGGTWGGGGRMPNVQLPMPGLGGMAAAMSAIPIAGALGAGSMMAAAGAYGSALRFQQARLQATPFMMRSGAATQFTGLQSRLVSERVPAAAGGTGVTPSEMLAPAYARSAGMVTGGAAPGLLGRTAQAIGETLGINDWMRSVVEPQVRNRQSTIRTLGRPSLAEAIGTPAQASQAQLQREYAAARLAEMDDPLGVQALAAQGLGRQAGTRTRRQAIRPFDESGLRRAGLGMGFAPAQSMQMAMQLSQAAGGPAGTGDIEGAMALQRTLGIGMQQTGAGMRAMRRVGGEGSVQEVADTIATSIVIGLEGSEIGEELGAQTNFLRTQASQGVKFNVSALERLAVGLGSGQAFDAFRVGDVSRQFAGGVSQIGMQGVQGPVQQRLLEAQLGIMGRSGMTNIEDYSEALFRMQSGQDLPELLPRFLESFKLGQGQSTPFFQSRIFQQALMGVGGTRIGPEEAMAITQGAMVTDDQGKAQFDMAKAITAAQELLKAQGGLVGAEARLEGQRIGVGAEIAPAMLKLQESTLNLAGAFNNIAGDALEAVANATARWTSLLERGTDAMESRWGPGESVQP